MPLERVVSVGLRAIASHAYPGLDEVYVCAYSREEKDAVCDALDALENDSAGNEVAHSEDADRRYAERLRAELDEERARERAANEARDAAYARSLQQGARARAGRRPRPAMRPTRGRYSRTARAARREARDAGVRARATAPPPAPSDEGWTVALTRRILTPTTTTRKRARVDGRRQRATSRRRRRGSRAAAGDASASVRQRLTQITIDEGDDDGRLKIVPMMPRNSSCVVEDASFPWLRRRRARRVRGVQPSATTSRRPPTPLRIDLGRRLLELHEATTLSRESRSSMACGHEVHGGFI